MAVSTGAALLGSAAIGAAGSAMNDSGGSQSVQGFAALPKEVQELWLKSYLPAAQKQFEKPYEAVPMQRYNEAPNSPFFSQGMADMQAYSDSKGGMFTPYGQPPQQGMTDADARKAMQEQVDALREEMLGRDIAKSGASALAKNTGRLTADDYRYLSRMKTPFQAADGSGLNLSDPSLKHLASSYGG